MPKPKDKTVFCLNFEFFDTKSNRPVLNATKLVFSILVEALEICKITK